jgi:hypothetical protein
MREYALVLGLGLALVFQATDNSTPSPIQLKAVLDSIATAIGTEYYDPKAAASWLLNEKLYESRILGAKTKLEAADEIRSALADLHNSHVFFYTHDEWALRRNVLPFTFEKRDGRVFVRTTLAPNETKFGDEITEIDGSSASTLRAKSLAKLSGVYGNPLYGQASSVAILTVVSNGKVREEQVRRIKMDDQDPIQTRELGSNVFFIRFLNLAGGAPVYFPLAQLGLARTHAMQADLESSRKTYDDFFAIWKDADPNIPLLRQAKVEYKKLTLRPNI